MITWWWSLQKFHAIYKDSIMISGFKDCRGHPKEYLGCDCEEPPPNFAYFECYIFVIMDLGFIMCKDNEELLPFVHFYLSINPSLACSINVLPGQQLTMWSITFNFSIYLSISRKRFILSYSNFEFLNFDAFLSSSFVSYVINHCMAG